MNAILLSSDRVRKQLYGVSPLHRVTEAEKAQLYSTNMNQNVYKTLLAQANQIVSLGFNVIVDATFLQYKHRVPFYELCHTPNNTPIFSGVIYLKTPIKLATLAIQSRQQQNNNPSDANVSVMLKQRQYLEPPTSSENVETVRFTKTAVCGLLA